MICCGSRSSVVMQLVQFSQVSDCGYLQEIEIILAGVTNVGDVTIEGRTPAIVLIDIAVPQQVAPPSERTCTFYGLRSYERLLRSRKTNEPFRSVNFSGVM